MSEIVNLFPHSTAKPNTKTPSQLLDEMQLDALYADKAIVILINDRAGVWDTKWGTANMDNSEANLALDVLKKLVLDTIMGQR